MWLVVTLNWSSSLQCLPICALLHVATVGRAACVKCNNVCLLTSVEAFRRRLADDSAMLKLFQKALIDLEHVMEGVCVCVCVCIRVSVVDGCWVGGCGCG